MESLAKLSSVAALLGLSLLFVVSIVAEPEAISISDIDDADKKDVKVTGRVIGVRDFGGFAVMEIAEVKSVGVVVFDKRLLRETGQNITVSGEIRDYRGRKEIIADSIYSSSLRQ